jgi:hypothetical protein
LCAFIAKYWDIGGKGKKCNGIEPLAVVQIFGTSNHLLYFKDPSPGPTRSNKEKRPSCRGVLDARWWVGFVGGVAWLLVLLKRKKTDGKD